MRIPEQEQMRRATEMAKAANAQKDFYAPSEEPVRISVSEGHTRVVLNPARAEELARQAFEDYQENDSQSERNIQKAIEADKKEQRIRKYYGPGRDDDDPYER